MFILYEGYCYLKYFIYFNLFLNSLFINFISYKLTKKLYFLKYLYFTININGCFLIKLSQWFNTQLFALDDKLLQDYGIANLKNLFNTFYEDCYIHNLKYTKQIFKEEYNKDLDEIIELDENYKIKSGSMAQIYKGKLKNNSQDVALKVVHPEIKYQIFFPEYLIHFYQYLVNNNYYFKKYETIFDFNSFIKNLKLQSNMHNEFKNITYYYNYFKYKEKNEYIIIPKPLMVSNNILIMEYINGELFDEIDVSELEKKKIISLFALFVKESYLFMDYFHNDIHNANWKVIKYKDFYKLIIYDFGYLIENNFKNTLSDIIYYFDVNDKIKISKILYNYISDKNKISKEDFSELFLSHLKRNTLPYNDDFLIQIYNFFYIYKFKVINNLLEFFIFMILVRKNLKNYFLQKEGDDLNIYKYHCQTYLYYITICKKYNIFNNIKNYFYEKYFNNEDYLNLLSYKDDYFDNLDSINNNENFDI